MTSPTQQRGYRAESYAKDYLIQQGLSCRETQYQSKVGEIDLIMQQDATLVFVEVRYRQKAILEDIMLSVNPAKQKRLKKTATDYLIKRQLYDESACRFDLVAMAGEGEHFQLEWLQNFIEEW